MKKVMISSTALDLPEHRKEVLEACLRQGFFPVMMEHLTAADTNAKAKSLEMVDEADIYLGILGYRYGYVPEDDNPDRISITEMEYDRAVDRGIPRLIFFMDKTHPLTAADMEEDTKDPVESARRKVKLEALKTRSGTDRVVGHFKSAMELRALVIQALGEHRDISKTPAHYESDIPTAPEPYIAHVYTLLQTPTLIGRQKELKLLTDWVTDADGARIMSFVAIGGTGKSAVTWHWFKHIAPQEMKPLAGQMWWSFYESDATFENFVTRALAYVTHRPLKEVREISAPDRESQLLAVINREPFLIVLDGLERLLIAYARFDAALLDDSQVGGERNLRKTIDSRVGRFMRKLAQTKNSRILLSTRLYPAELETDGGEPISGNARYQVPGLSDEDAVELWRAFGVSGARADLLPIFDSIQNHPLLIQALGGALKRYHRAPGDFDKWREANPRFDPVKIPGLSDRMAHVLKFALTELDEVARKTLQILAAFRRPTGYGALLALLVGEGKPCSNEKDLDPIFNELENRGLLGWDERANRYDLHPIVRGVIWKNLGSVDRKQIFTNLRSYFEATPMINDHRKIRTLEDLTPALGLYDALIGLKLYDEACDLFYQRIGKAMHFRLSASRQQAVLLEQLFPDGTDAKPRLSESNAQGFAFNTLGQAYKLIGQPGKAAPMIRSYIAISEEANDYENLAVGFCNMADIALQSGRLREAEFAARSGLILSRRLEKIMQAVANLDYWGTTLAVCGRTRQSLRALTHSMRIAERSLNHYRPYDSLAMRALWSEDFKEAYRWAKKALANSSVAGFMRGKIRAHRLLGIAYLGLLDFKNAENQLQEALVLSREAMLAEEELPTVTALSEIHRSNRELLLSRGVLTGFWEIAESGPYPLFYADALNVLAQIERDAGNMAAAIKAATQAYQLAWCDGPPYAYHWGLVKAQKHLEDLGAPLPEMPPFDEWNFEPMPEVEIDPDNEFNANAKPSKKSRTPSPIKTVVREEPKIGPNDPCSCGSGKKYKKCCGS
jgi:tetratricopeptide (TPR) repeat protein